MIGRLLVLLQLLLLPLGAFCTEKYYALSADCIDVVIPCAEKDVSTSLPVSGHQTNGPE